MSGQGRPGESPVRLLGVSILQFMEKLPDRQAVEALTFDLRWGMEADEGGFHQIQTKIGGNLVRWIRLMRCCIESVTINNDDGGFL